MKTTATAIPEVLIVEPDVHGDERGYFLETWHARRYADAGITTEFVQDNRSRSRRGVLRGLHYQLKQPQETRRSGVRRHGRFGCGNQRQLPGESNEILPVRVNKVM